MHSILPDEEEFLGTVSEEEKKELISLVRAEQQEKKDRNEKIIEIIFE